MGLIRSLLDRLWEWNNRPREMTAEELVTLLRRMRDGGATDGEWDYFDALKLADPELEPIRAEVARLYGPAEFNPSTDPIMAAAIARAEAIAARDLI